MNNNLTLSEKRAKAGKVGAKRRWAKRRKPAQYVVRARKRPDLLRDALDDLAEAVDGLTRFEPERAREIVFGQRTLTQRVAYARRMRRVVGRRFKYLWDMLRNEERAARGRLILTAALKDT